jgi:hypothetical protein
MSNVIVVTLASEFIFKIFLDSSNWGSIAANIRFYPHRGSVVEPKEEAPY